LMFFGFYLQNTAHKFVLVLVVTQENASKFDNFSSRNNGSVPPFHRRLIQRQGSRQSELTYYPLRPLWISTVYNELYSLVGYRFTFLFQIFRKKSSRILFKICFNIILPSTSRSFRPSFFFTSPNPTPINEGCSKRDRTF
jgi:hypothetical protein